jgi:MarR family
MLQLVAAVLQLNASWVPAEPESFADLVVRRGRDNVLTYDDGISLRVQLIDPAAYGSAEDLVVRAKNAADQAGQVALVGGAVPVAWRAALRRAGLSFVDVGGVVEIDWPRLRASSAQFGKEVVRRRQPASLQKGHALVAEELLMAATAGQQLTVTELARQAGVDKSIASRTVAQLAGLGLVERSGYQGALHVAGLADLAELIAVRTAWPGTEVVAGYAWGRTIFDTAATVSRKAADAGIEIAVTGRVGAAFLGVLGTSSPSQVRCWVRVTGRSLEDVAAELGLEPTRKESANVRVAADRWRIGVHRRAIARFDELTAMVAHPLRVWCDLHGEQRGSEFAAQLWGEISHA